MSVSSVKTGATGISLLTGNAFYEPGDFSSITTVTVGSGGTSSVTFSSIPSTYTHLQIRYISRGLGSANNDTYDIIQFTFNGVAGTSYAWHEMAIDGNTSGAVMAQSGSSAAYVRSWSAGNLSVSGNYGAGVVDILDYANTSKNKTVRMLSGFDNNGNLGGNPLKYYRYGSASANSGLYLSTNAITSITINGIGNLDQYSSFALYGITA